MVNGYRLGAFLLLACFKLPLSFFFASSYIVLGRRLGKDTTQPSYPCKLSSTHPVLHITKPGAVCSFCLKLHRGMDMHREYIALSNRR